MPQLSNKAREEALAAHELARQKMTQRNMKHMKPFKQGQKVWLESRNLHIPYASQRVITHGNLKQTSQMPMKFSLNTKDRETLTETIAIFALIAILYVLQLSTIYFGIHHISRLYQQLYTSSVGRRVSRI